MYKMEMIIFVLFILSIFSPVLSIIQKNTDEIIFDEDEYTNKFEATESKYFNILFSEKAFDYVKIEVKNLDTSQAQNLAIAFSNSDENCLKREQLSYGLNNIQMWLTKSQIKNLEENYINIMCSSYPCTFNLALTRFNDNIRINFNSQFNLYVTENNNKVKIHFSSEFSNDEFENVTIWTIGYKDVKADLLSGDFEYKKYSKNNIFKINNNIFSIELSLEGEEGDVINIGSSTTNSINSTYYNNIIMNQPEVKGYLHKGYSDEECYDLREYKEYSTIFYLSGFFYSKIAEIYYKENDNDEIAKSVIRNGSFIHNINPNEENIDYFCIKFPNEEIESEKYDINEIFYSLQLTDPSKSENKIFLYSPQIYGEIYPRRLPEGETYLYTGISPNDVNKLSLNMIPQFGSPSMYYFLCENYPLCDNYEKNAISSKKINSHYNQNIIYTKTSPMDPNQLTLVIKCEKKYNLGSICGFKTSFHSDKERINLKEGEPFYQYILNEQKDLYKIDYSGETKIKEIIVELIVFTGDVVFNIEDTDLEYKKIYSLNKIFYNINIGETSLDKEINFVAKASRNSYYSIEYMPIRENDDSWKYISIIESGISSLVSIDPELKMESNEEKPNKLIKFSNTRIIDGKAFLVQFYSLNCKLNIKARVIGKEEKEYNIESFNEYYQDYIEDININNLEYKLYVEETDTSIFKNKLCAVYASSLELGYNKNIEERQITINDNEPKQLVCKKDKNKNYIEVQYLYPHAYLNNDVIINFNLLDPAEYEVDITIGKDKRSTYSQSGNDLIYLHRNEWDSRTKTYCKKNEICPITIKILLKRAIYNEQPKLLISVKAVQNGIPSYLPKNKVGLDVLLGNNWQYYYTDLGFEDEGDVIVSYKRGSGRIFAKIVSKNSKPEEEANWREMYKFPTTVEESLEFNGYIKKILIKKEDTKICGDGCYLLISLKTSIVSNNYNFDFREHPFSILVHTKPSEKVEDIPIISIPINDYIIGNLNSTKDTISEYYSAIFTHDANKILIDFQSRGINLYINVCTDRKPSINSYDFKFESNGNDIIYQINKDEYINKCEKHDVKVINDTLMGFNITIGLWTNKTDSFYTSVYSMKVNIPDEELLEIYQVKSDQKTLCKTKNKVCLFMVFYYGIDLINQLVLYPIIQDNSPFNIKAKFIHQEKYVSFDHSYLKDILVREPDYNNDNGLDYIYIEHGDEHDTFLYINITTKEETIVELLTSLYNKSDVQLSPNPSSSQLFSITGDHFSFEFPTNESLIITIQSICGEGKIYWEVDNDDVKYDLYGNGHIISLTNSLIDKTDDKKVFSNLGVKNINLNSKRCPGFTFLIDYLLRPTNINLDEIQIGKTTQFAYRNTDFPVYIYSKLTDLSEDINIFVNIYEIINNTYTQSAQFTQFTKEVPFKIEAHLINEMTLLEYKLNPELLNKTEFDFKGVFDTIIKTGFILIKKDNLKNESNDYIIFKISKCFNFNLTRINLEAAVIQDNNEISVIPDIYHYGKLSLNNDKNIYKLKTVKYMKYMRIEFSPNSQYITYTISNEKGDKKSTFNFEEEKFINGKYVITFESNPNINHYVYLNIFHADIKAKNESLTNYVFKYMNAENKDDFRNYKLSDEKGGFEIEEKKSDNKYNYTFYITPIKDEEQFEEVTYFIKIVEKSDWIDGEKNNSIALRESPSYVEQFKNYNGEKAKITIKFELIKQIDYRYIQVIALIRDTGYIEFIGYDSIAHEPNNPHSGLSAWAIALVIIASIIVFIIVLFLIHIYLKKIRNLDKKVQKIEGPMVSRYSEAATK